MTKEQKISLFKEALDKFETEEVKVFCSELIELMPEDAIVCSSSSTGKYHNAHQCKIFGNLYHTLMLCEIGNYLLELEHNQEKFPNPNERDCIRLAMCLHDSVKYGWNGAQYTQFTHPLMAAEFIKTAEVEHPIPKQGREYCADLVSSHSGQWNTSNRSKTVLPKPETEAQKLVHECDYLSSRSNIDMIYSDELDDTIYEIIKDMINTYEFNFGKYKGQTVKSVLNSNPEYFSWMEENGGLREPYKMIIEKLKERERRPEF